MELDAIVRDALTRHGIEHIEESGAFHMIMCSGTRKWRTFISVSGGDIICCAQFPWKAGGSALAALNELNLTQSVGCFMVMDGYVVLRVGSVMVDAMEAGELVISLLRRCGNEVCRCWSMVCSAAEVGK